MTHLSPAPAPDALPACSNRRIDGVYIAPNLVAIKLIIINVGVGPWTIVQCFGPHTCHHMKPPNTDSKDLWNNILSSFQTLVKHVMALSCRAFQRSKLVVNCHILLSHLKARSFQSADSCNAHIMLNICYRKQMKSLTCSPLQELLNELSAYHSWNCTQLFEHRAVQ